MNHYDVILILFLIRFVATQQTFVGLEDVLKTCVVDVLKTCVEDVLKTCLEDVLKTCLDDVLKTCLDDVLKTYLEDVLKTLWRQTNLGISVSNKSKCISNKSIFHKSISDNSKTNRKCIN